MSTELALTVTEAFEHWCRTSKFKVCKVSDDEALLVGCGFGLLICVDRDGLAMWYLDLGSEKNEMVDVGGYLATQRKWYIDESVPLDGSPESQRVRGLRSFAKTLNEVGQDILAGEKAWLKLVNTRPLPLSLNHYSNLRTVATNCAC